MSITSVSSDSTLSSISRYLSSNTSMTNEDIEALEEKLEEAYAQKAKEAASSGSSSADSTATLYTNMTSASEDTKKLIKELASSIENGGSDSIQEKISEFVTSYNSMISYLKKAGTAECSAMINAFAGYFRARQDDLSAVGITINSSTGKLTVDADKLSLADTETLSSLFGSSSSMMSSVEKLTESSVTVASMKASAHKALSTLYGDSGQINEYTLTQSFLDMMS